MPVERKKKNIGFYSSIGPSKNKCCVYYYPFTPILIKWLVLVFYFPLCKLFRLRLSLSLSISMFPASCIGATNWCHRYLKLMSKKTENINFYHLSTHFSVSIFFFCLSEWYHHVSIHLIKPGIYSSLFAPFICLSSQNTSIYSFPYQWPLSSFYSPWNFTL